MRDCGVFAVWSSPVVDELSLGTARWRAGLRSRAVKCVCEARVVLCAGAREVAGVGAREVEVAGV